jgi:hypothetical protein
MTELEQLKRENELLRELVKAKDATIDAMHEKRTEPVKEIVCVPTWWPYPVPCYPPPQPYTVQRWTVTSGSTTAADESKWVSLS